MGNRNESICVIEICERSKTFIHLWGDGASASSPCRRPAAMLPADACRDTGRCISMSYIDFSSNFLRLFLLGKGLVFLPSMHHQFLLLGRVFFLVNKLINPIIFKYMYLNMCVSYILY